MENGVSLTQLCYSASSWSKNTWYALTVGNDTFAFKTPSSGSNSLVISEASQPTLKSGVTIRDGTSIFGGMGYTDASVSGGSSVSITAYSGGNGSPDDGGRLGGSGWL